MTRGPQTTKLANLLAFNEMNSMTIAMQEAVAKAGTPMRLPSHNQIVWTWLRDHPHSTYKEIATAVHLTETAVSQRLHELLNERGMVTRRRGSRHGRGVWEYAAVGKEYELLPRKSSKRAPESATKAERDTHIAKMAEMVTPPAARTGFDIEQYTLGELRAIYADLKRLFG